MGPAPGPAAAPAPADSILVLHTNDTHSHLDPFDPSGGGSPVGGAAARAALLQRERGAATLTLDAGDAFQGTPYYNHFRGVPEYRAMSLMGYDAAALGNHELDDGPASWLRAKRDAGLPIPILSANVFAAAESVWALGLVEAHPALRRHARWIGGAPVPDVAPLKQLCAISRSLSVGGRRIALLGLTTGELTHIVSVRRNAGVAVSDPVASAAELVPDLRRSSDVVIVLSHLGLDEDRRLAARVPGIDVIVGGHSHTLLKAPVFVLNAANENGYHGTAIVQAGSRGEWVGRTTLHFEGRRLSRVTGTVLPVRPEEGEEAEIARLLEPYRDSMATAMSVRVLRSPRRYGTEGLRDGDTPLGNFVADALRDAAGADVAIQNVGGIRAGIPAGDVTVGALYTVLPFDNRVVVVDMKGWQVRQLLDFIARRIGGGGFAQVSGVRFGVRRDRATDIRVGGAPLESDRTYRVATIDFLYDGGDGYTAFAKAGPAHDSGLFQRDAAIEFLRRHPGYAFRDDGRIRWEGSTEALRDLRMR
jgi:2',3'-cyclic-nucleotide 2'-phosphodiesterase (5'-nucleotidase family)